jgi:hypothetical protein
MRPCCNDIDANLVDYGQMPCSFKSEMNGCTIRIMKRVDFSPA